MNDNGPIKIMPLDLTDLIAITALSIGFVMSIYAGMLELAMSLATGFFGYIGGYTSGSSKSVEKKNPKEEGPESGTTTTTTEQDTTKK